MFRGVSSSSKSHPSNSSILQPTPRTIEEVWNNITCDHHHHQDHSHSPHGHATPMRRMILQDFLAGPPKQAATPPETSREIMSDAALHPPATILSLNSGLNFLATSNSSSHQHEHQHWADTDRDNHPHCDNQDRLSMSPFVDSYGFQEPSGIFSFCGKKRPPEQQQTDGSGEGGDRRQSRTIKNRESAARSRARKQAYINELEVLNKDLLEENAMLKKEYEKLKSALAAQLPVKKKLHRTSTV